MPTSAGKTKPQSRPNPSSRPRRPRAKSTPGAKRGRGGGLTYAESGVDIDAGDRFTQAIAGFMRRTHGPRVLSNDGGFAGLFRLDFNERLFQRNYKEPVLVAATDGVVRPT